MKKKNFLFSWKTNIVIQQKKSNSICMILSDQKNGIYNFFQVMYAYIMYNKAIKVENWNNNHKNEIKFHTINKNNCLESKKKLWFKTETNKKFWIAVVYNSMYNDEMQQIFF